MYIYIYVYIYNYLYIYTYIYMCVCVMCLCVYAYACLCVCVYVCGETQSYYAATLLIKFVKIDLKTFLKYDFNQFAMVKLDPSLKLLGMREEKSFISGPVFIESSLVEMLFSYS